MKDDRFTKSLDLLVKLLNETPRKELLRMIEEIDKLPDVGIPIEEYLEYFNYDFLSWNF